MAKISSRKSRGQPTTTKSANKEMPNGVTLALPPPSPNPNLPITNDVSKIMNLLNRITVVLENNQNEGLGGDLGDNQNNEKNPKNNNRRGRKPKDNNDRNKNPKDNKLKDFFKRMTNSTTKIIEKNSTSIRSAFLGPMNLLVKPFEDFFGGSVFDGMKSLVDKGKSLIQKFTKKKPNENDVVKAGVNGVGFLYLGGLLEKIFGKDKEGKDISGGGGISGFFKGLIGGSGKGVGAMATGIGSKLLKALPIASLVVGLIWAVIDGVKGFFKAKDWGVSKLSGVIGGVLASTESGWKNAFKNGGKFALIGVGIGAVGGPIGMIIGGLVGGAIGGILGFFGGQKVANFFETHIKPYFTDTLFPAIKEYFLSIIGLDQLKAIGDIWKGEGSFMKKLGRTLVDVTLWIWGSPWRIIKAMGTAWNKILIKPIVNLFKKVNWKELWDKIWNGLKNFFSPSNLKAIWDGMVKGIGDFFSGIWRGLKNFFSPSNLKAIWDVVVKGIGDFFSGIWEGLEANSVATLPFGEFVNNLFSIIGDGITNFLENNPIGQWLTKHIISPITNFFSMIGDFFSGIWKGLKSFASSVLNSPFVGFVNNLFSIIGDGITNFLENNPIGQWIDKWVVKPIIHSFSMIGDFFSGIWKGLKNFFSPRNLKSIWVGMVKGIGDFFSGIWKGLKSFARNPKSIWDGMVKGIGDFFSGIWRGLKNFFSPSNLKAVWDGMVKGIGDFFSGIWKGLKSFGNSVTNLPFGEFVSNLFSTIGDSITDFLKNNPIGQWLDKHIISPIVGFFSTIGDFFGFIGSLGLSGLWEIATSKKVSFASKFDEYKASKETTVNDAIIRTDGSIIHTHPDDNIIATKNLPTNLDSLYTENNNNLNKNLSNLDSNVKVSEKLDRMVDLLERLLDKEPINVSLPPQTRQDLDLLMNGGLL